MLNPADMPLAAGVAEDHVEPLEVSKLPLVPGAATTNYSQMGADELATATGYSRPGQLLTSVTPTADGTTAILDFTNETWTSSTFTTCGGLIYDTGDSDSACAVLSFGGDQTVSSGDFQIQFPAAAASTAIIRIA